MMYSAMEVVKQQMARVNIDVLGISELEWVNLTQMTITSATVGKNPLEAKQTAHVELLMTSCPQALHWLQQVT